MTTITAYRKIERSKAAEDEAAVNELLDHDLRADITRQCEEQGLELVGPIRVFMTEESRDSEDVTLLVEAEAVPVG